MSKDLTPREFLMFEDFSIAKGGISIWEMYETTIMHYGDETWPMCPPEELAKRKGYPLLGKLLHQFAELYDKLAEIVGGLEFLRQKDAELAEYVNEGKGDRDSYLIRWFEGELDPCFYYSEYNDELFHEHILAEATEKGENL